MSKASNKRQARLKPVHAPVQAVPKPILSEAEHRWLRKVIDRARAMHATK